jgi:predicted enzyme related to lactoylglutathione lyase
MPITFTHNTPILPVADVVRTQQYYRDVLGFTIDWRDREVFGGVSLDSVSFFFQRTDAAVRAFSCVLNTPDADEVFRSYSENGAKIVEPIATRPWGMREFTIEDPSGHFLRIGHIDESMADYISFHPGKRKS